MRFVPLLLIAVAAGVADAVCEDWCNQYTCVNNAADCGTCAVCVSVAAETYCAAWCNDYTCAQGLCKGCSACDYLDTGGTRCLGWCNTYTCGQDDCKTCDGMNGSPNCLDQTTFCEGWCNAWTCNSPYCVGCSSCEACTCAATWTDATCTAPTATQTGCTNCDGDAAGNWCNVAKQPCAGSAIAGGDYFYCGTATGRRMVEEAEALEGPSNLVEDRA